MSLEPKSEDKGNLSGSEKHEICLGMQNIKSIREKGYEVCQNVGSLNCQGIRGMKYVREYRT